MTTRSTEVPPPRRIVAAYDGSEPSYRAIRFALSLLRDPETRVWLVHAIEASRVVAEPRTEEERGSEARAIETTLERAAKQYDPSGARVRPLVREGHPADVILGAAAEVEADLIVVGTRGLRAAERLVLGSVSASVLNRSSRPVTVVP